MTMESYICNGTLCPKMTSARNGFGKLLILSF